MANSLPILDFTYRNVSLIDALRSLLNDAHETKRESYQYFETLPSRHVTLEPVETIATSVQILRSLAIDSGLTVCREDTRGMVLQVPDRRDLTLRVDYLPEQRR